MLNILSDLAASPFVLSILLLHSLVLAQCFIKFIDYNLTQEHVKKIS